MIRDLSVQPRPTGLTNLSIYEAYLDKKDAREREYKLKHHSQTRELLYKQIETSIRMAHSSSG